MATSQKYIIDSNDEVKPNFVTDSNKNNLIAGGLFDGLTLGDQSGLAAANFVTRDLLNSDSNVTLNWENLTLNGVGWGTTGSFDVGGQLNVAMDAAVEGNVSADTFSGNFVGNFTGNVDISDIGTDDAYNLFQTANITTDNVPEGNINLYYSDQNFRDSINTVVKPQTPITGSFDDSGNYNLELSGVTGLVTTGKTLHVNTTSGNDTRTGISSYDFANPYKTIMAAKADAAEGDTIIVWPGTYEDEYDLLKGGVDYFFMPGAVVVQTSTFTLSVPIFRDATATTANVLGYGKFVTNSNTVTTVISVANAASKIRIQGDLVQSTTAGSGHNIVSHIGGSLELEVRKILSTGLGIRTTTDILILKNSYVVAALGSAVETKGTQVTCLIDNCQLESQHVNDQSGAIFIEPNSSGVRVKNCILVTASNYAITTTLTMSAVVSILSGVTANKVMYDGVVAEQLAPFTVDETFALTIF